MGSMNHSSHILVTCMVAALLCCANGQLSPTFYATTCPSVQAIVFKGMLEAVSNFTRNAAFILRMHFHDCFVNGCDGSVLLDDTATFTGEKNAGPNVNSLQGFDVIDAIKSQVEAACSGVVSCADILALAAQYGVAIMGGPGWEVPLGRRDATTASQSAANSNLPSPLSDLPTLIQQFQSKNLTQKDLTALSGAHTIGFAHCLRFRNRIYNESNIDPAFANAARANCPPVGGDSNLSPLDFRTPARRFDNNYYVNLVHLQGLLHSDQQLHNLTSPDPLVLSYALNPLAFFADFAAAMVKMGNIMPLTGTAGEIRKNCRVIN